MKKTLSILFICTGAASIAPAGSLTWSESLSKASVGNPDLGSAESTLKANQEAERAAYSDYLPQLSANLNYSQGNSMSSGSLDLGGSDATSTTYTANLTATQNLFAGFEDKARVDQAKGNTELAKATLEGTKSQVSYDLKSAFASLNYAQSYVSLSADIIKRRESNLRLVQLRFESGRENRGSVMLSKAYLEQSKYDRLQAQNAVESAKIQLAKILGMEDHDDLAVAGEVPLNEPPASPDFHGLAGQNPELKQAAAREKIAAAGLTLAQAGFYPTLNLTGTTADVGPDWFPNRNRWSVGLALAIPLFNGGRDYYGTKSAKENLRAASYARQSGRGTALTKLKQSYATYLEAALKVSVDQSFVQASTEREKIAREKYNNGLQTFEDWDLIENDLISRQKSLLQTLRDRVTAEASWEQVQGKGSLP